MTSILAPVSFSKSGARRCSGSAIWGPVNVTTRTVVPLNWPFVFELLELQAASRPTPIKRARARVRCRLMSFSSPFNPEDGTAPDRHGFGPAATDYSDV